jgi:NADH-quinone oxidoreductase subunit F
VASSCTRSAGIDVPGFVSLIGEKRYAEALRLHCEKNPFASVCARVCFHTCEDKCRRSSAKRTEPSRGGKACLARLAVAGTATSIVA